MAYTLLSNGTPLSTIPFFPNAGLLGLRGMRGLRGLGGFYDLPNEPNWQTCVNSNPQLVEGYTGGCCWFVGGMKVSGPDLAHPYGPYVDTTSPLYPILMGADCKPYPDTTQAPTSNPSAALQAASTAQLQTQFNKELAAQQAAVAAATQPVVVSLQNNSTAPPAGSTNSTGSAPSGTVASTDWFTSSMFSGIPNWGLLAAAVGVAALFFMQGGHHGR